MRLLDVCLIGPYARPGEPPARLGVPLLDDYLRFVAGRCRPNTVLAAAYDLKVFFTDRATHRARGGVPQGGRGTRRATVRRQPSAAGAR